MKLVWSVFVISSKHTGRRLVCLLCVFGLCAGLCGALFAALPAETGAFARVAVICADNDPMAETAVRLFSGSDYFEGRLLLDVYRPDEPFSADDYIAVAEIPPGFTQSILRGENLSPTLTLHSVSPVESMIAVQLSQAAVRYLSASQLAIYAALDLSRRAGVPEERHDKLVAQVNLLAVKAMLGRYGGLDIRQVQADGSVSLSRYYLCAVGSLLLFCFCALFIPSGCTARRFSDARPGTLWQCWLGVLLHILAITVPVGLLLTGGALIGLSLGLLLGGYAIIVCACCRRELTGGCGCLMVSVLLGAASGCFLPAPLLPPAFASLRLFSPVYWGLRLLGCRFGGVAFEPALAALLCFALLTAGSLVLWLRGGAHR